MNIAGLDREWEWKEEKREMSENYNVFGPFCHDRLSRSFMRVSRRCMYRSGLLTPSLKHEHAPQWVLPVAMAREMLGPLFPDRLRIEKPVGAQAPFVQ